MRVKRESRAGDDGYRSGLLPGLRASGDAEALAQEIAFAHGRLLALGAAPPDLYGEVRALAEEDIERATWTCFLIAYLSPLDGEDPFLGIRLVLDAVPDSAAVRDEQVLGDLDRIPLGPRTSHDPARGTATLSPTAIGPSAREAPRPWTVVRQPGRPGRPRMAVRQPETSVPSQPVTATPRTRSRAIPSGARSGASSGASSASRCPASVAWGAMTCS